MNMKKGFRDFHNTDFNFSFLLYTTCNYKKLKKRKDTQYFYTDSSDLTDYVEFLINQSSSIK